MSQGIHRCASHDYSTNGDSSLEDQEEEWYQHQRDEEHTFRVSKPCQNCTKKVQRDDVVGKVPQPTPDVKNPRSPIVFCDDKCRDEYLTKLGVKA